MVLSLRRSPEISGLRFFVPHDNVRSRTDHMTTKEEKWLKHAPRGRTLSDGRQRSQQAHGEAPVSRPDNR